MAVIAEVEYESRVRLRYGAIAFVGAVLLVLAQLLLFSGEQARVSELTIELIVADANRTRAIIGAALNLIGLGCVAITLAWLHRVTSARKPEIRSIVRWMAMTGAVLAAVMGLVAAVMVSSKAHQFVTTGNQSYPEAHALTSTALLLTIQLLQELGLLVLALGCIWVSLNAMRVGLITKLVGYSGVIAGALFLFPLGALVPLIQGFWLAAIAVTMAERWPAGDPPAWKAGEAVPWPSATRPTGDEAQTRQARQPRQRQAASAAPGIGALFGFGRKSTPPPPPPEPKSTPTPPRTGTPKRKRKRRS